MDDDEQQMDSIHELQEEEQKPATLPDFPTVKCSNLSPEAQTMIQYLEDALANQDGHLLSNLIFDAECENFGDQIDLQWYEQHAATLIKAQEDQ